ncbi:hypothetical protein SDC9_186186 [bioreactor metagenome]|uniref:Uncharacterized protein n=1 Tax=bioreactor metagenome TaxID=1076179 RepID=A0A645HJV1_9ZZZZ
MPDLYADVCAPELFQAAGYRRGPDGCGAGAASYFPLYVPQMGQLLFSHFAGSAEGADEQLKKPQGSSSAYKSSTSLFLYTQNQRKWRFFYDKTTLSMVFNHYFISRHADAGSRGLPENQ